MAWDFETDPEFEEKLAWMRSFVREEVYPLETLSLTYDQIREIIKPMQEEVKARGARVLGVGNPDDASLQRVSQFWIPLPEARIHECLLPFLVTPVIQLLSYEIAVLKGTDIDKPRNLAKSVTVE